MIRIRFKQFLRNLKKPLELIGFIFGVIFITAYGLGAGFLLIYGGKGELSDFPVEWLSNIIISIAVFATVMRMFKPNYVPMRQILMKYQPISALQRYLYSLATDFQNVYFFFWFVFLIGVIIISGSEGILLFITVISALFSGHLLRRTAQYFIDYRQKRTSVIYLVFVLAAVIGVSFVAGSNWFLPGLFLIGAVLFFFGFYLEQNNIEKKKVVKKEKNRSWALKMILNNKNVRTPLLVGLILKLLLLIADIVLYKTNKEHLFDGKGFYWVFISSATIFTYIFNNTWGFWRSAWLNYELRSGSTKGMFLFFWKTIQYPILLDMVVTFGLVFFIQSDYIFVLLFYFTTLISLTATAFLWSILFPKRISHVTPKKGSTSYWSIAYVFLSVMSLSLVSIGGLMYMLVPLFLILAIIGLVVAFRIYPEKKYALFSNLFRSE